MIERIGVREGVLASGAAVRIRLELEARRACTPGPAGEVDGDVALANRLGRQAPINARLVGLVKEAERGGKRDFAGAELWRALTG